MELAIEMLEDRLETLHGRVRRLIHRLRTESQTQELAAKLERSEKKIGGILHDLEVLNTEHLPVFKELVRLEMWHELDESIIEALKRDIEDWLALDQELIDIEENYTRS